MDIEITSLRKINNEAFYDVVFEWEDVMAETFKTQLISISPLLYLGKMAYCKLNKRYTLNQNFRRKKCSVYFVMYPTELRERVFENGIPIFMDAWSDRDIEYIIKKTAKLQLFYCTSLEVYNRIKSMDKESKVKYMPLSVSDMYFSKNFSKYNKSIDVIQIGRRNPLLHDFMMQYINEHNEIEYVYNKSSHSGLAEYISTKKGYIGHIEGRKDFIKNLSSAKVSLVSTPAIDNSRKDANGIDFLTPRFYESAVLGCALIGRYGENEETKRISNICPNIKTYIQFSAEMDKALSISNVELFEREEKFIKENLTSCRAAQIEKDIKSISLR